MGNWKIDKLKDWNITKEEYEESIWGSALGGAKSKSRFKVPASVIKRFRKYELQDENGKHPGDTGYDKSTEHQVDVGFDANGFFKEIATTIINAIMTDYDILQQVSLDWLSDSDKELVRLAVYNGIEYALLNKQIWENVNGARISMGNTSISQDRVNWSLSENMIGKKANNFLMRARLYDYQWMTEEEYFTKKQKGNVLVLGKVNIEHLPELI